MRAGALRFSLVGANTLLTIATSPCRRGPALHALTMFPLPEVFS